jgi:hypothetical protein
MVRKSDSQDDDSTVRHYKADGTLTVTRDDETNEHIIKSRGRDRDDRWTRRVPATRTTVDAGEELWSIPDNWNKHYRVKADHGSNKGIYHIPESETDVLVTMCHKNNHIVDAYHTVEEVGTIAWTAHADVDLDALTDALDYLDNNTDSFADGVQDILEYVRENPRDAVKDAEESAEMYAPECVEGWNGIPASEFDPFYETFRSENEMVTHPEYGPGSDVMAQVHDLLGDFDVLPPSPLVSVTVQSDAPAR